MTTIQRFGYYLGGFAIGLIFLMFFLSGKKTTCAYGPNARVLKNISTKKIIIPESFHSSAVDTNLIRSIIYKGKVDFSKSNTKLDSCKIYFVKADIDNTQHKIEIKNCSTNAIVLSYLKD